MRIASETFDFWPLSTPTVGSVVEDVAHKRSGASCGKAADAGFNIVEPGLLVPVLDRRYFYRLAVRLAALPSKTLPVLKLLDATNTVLEMSVNKEGKVEAWNGVAAAHPEETVPVLGAEEWGVIEVMLKINAEGNSLVSWRFNGVEQAAEQAMNFRNTGVVRVRSGNPGAQTTGTAIYIDDFGMNDETGHKNNTWLGLEPDELPERLRVYIGADIAETNISGPCEPAPYNEAIWDTFEVDAGRPMGIVHFGNPWHSAEDVEPGPIWDGYMAGGADRVHSRGAIPLISLGGPTDVIQQVNEEVFDAEIRKWAEGARDFGHPFFLRLWWEMNGTWFPWGRQAVSGEEYVAAWRRFHDIVSAIAPNVTFVWCPNVIFEGHPDPFGDEEKELDSMYPGDAYVDWAGFDGYSGENPHKELGFRTSKSVMGPIYERIQAEAPNKPIIICETACSEYAVHGGEPEPPKKAEWIKQLLGHTLPYEMPAVRAVCWFNWYIEEGGGRIDWPIETSPSATEAFATYVADSHYVGGEEAAAALKPGAKVPVPGGEQIFATARSTVPKSLDTIPKLSVPLRLANGSLATCEQDSQENVAACVYAVLAYERGSRIEDVDFGVEDPTFSELPLDEHEWREQIARYEPRAEIDTVEEAMEDIAAILVNVGLGA